MTIALLVMRGDRFRSPTWNGLPNNTGEMPDARTVDNIQKEYFHNLGSWLSGIIIPPSCEVCGGMIQGPTFSLVFYQSKRESRRQSNKERNFY